MTKQDKNTDQEKQFFFTRILNLMATYSIYRQGVHRYIYFSVLKTILCRQAIPECQVCLGIRETLWGLESFTLRVTFPSHS